MIYLTIIASKINFINMPTIKNKKIIANTKLFTIKELEITFGKGIYREYEVISGKGHAAVMIIPLQNNKIYFIKEFAAAINNYSISFPKGRVDEGETITNAANRELQEEIGFRSNKLSHIFTLSLAPGYIDHDTHIFLAEDLEPSKLEGDEPEELTIIQCNLNEIDILIDKNKNIESRAIACIYLLKKHLDITL